MGEQGLTIGHLDILILISQEINTATKISDKLKLPRTTITDRLKELKSHGYVRKIIAANMRLYELTSIGNEAVTKFSGRPETGRDLGSQGLRIHKIHWSSVITRRPWDFDDELKKNAFTVSQNKNWASYVKRFHEDDVTIVFNPKKVHFYVTAFYVSDPHEYYPDVQVKVVKLTKMLQEKYPGLVLGTPKKWHTIHSQHVAREGGPIAKAFEKHALATGRSATYHGSHLHIDHSEGVWEEETVDDRTAPDDMEQLGHFFNEYLKEPFMPKDVKNVGSEIQMVKEQQIVDSRANMEVLERFKGEAKNELAQLREGLGIIGQGQVAMNEGMLKLNDTLGRLTGSHEENVKVMSEFRVAMHEHLVLIKGLQRNASAMEEANKKQAKANEAQTIANREMIKALKELQKPWFVKLSESMKKLFKKN